MNEHRLKSTLLFAFWIIFMPIAELRGIVLYIARGDSKKFLIKFIKELVGKIATILRKQTENQYRFIKNKNLKFLVFYIQEIPT